MLNAGATVATFRKRLVIQNKVTTSDGQGGSIETWPDGDTIWASVTPLKGYEKFQAMQMQTPNTHKIMTRYRDDITTASRLTLDGRIFWVKEVVNVEERNRFLQIQAIERA
jgi:SPP1 family predicted phage head-tail adaptor